MEKQEDRERGYKDIAIPNTDSQQLLMPVLVATAHACIGCSCSCQYWQQLRMPVLAAATHACLAATAHACIGSV